VRETPPRGRRAWNMSHDESEEDYLSALEEPPSPRVVEAVRTRKRRSRLDGAIAYAQRRRQVEEKGRYLIMQIKGVAEAARERLVDANAKASVAKEDLEIAERILRRTLGSAAGLRRLALAVEHSGELPLGLTVETDHEPRWSVRPISCRSVTSSAWTPSTASLPSANAAARPAASFEEVGAAVRADATRVLAATKAGGASATEGTGDEHTCAIATPVKGKTSAAASARDETEASTSSDPSVLPSRAISRRGSDGVEADYSLPILDVGFPPLKLERRRARGRSPAQPRRPRAFVE